MRHPTGIKAKVHTKDGGHKKKKPRPERRSWKCPA